MSGPGGGGAASAPAWAVPAAVTDGEDVVTVSRAWPGRDHGVVTVEGRDQRGRLRAGTVLRRAGEEEVRLLAPGTDGRLPALAGLLDGAGADLVVHRAGRRAVVRHAGGYTKVVRPGRAGTVAEASLAGRALALAAGLAAPDVLDADDSSVTSAVLPGRPVHELADDAGWGGVWEAWASAWTRLQDLGDGAAGGLAPHTDEHEAQVVRRWAARAGGAGVLPEVWAVRAERVARRLEEQDGPRRLVPTHRDLHDKQLLWDGAELGVLDLDTACLAAPELDPANLAVHADLRRAQGLWSGEAAEVVVRAARGAAEGSGADAARVEVAELATVVRLACVYAFRPPWRDEVLAWAEGRFALGGGGAA